MIDTCVMMDAIQNREPFAGDAQAIFRAAANKWFTGCMSAKAVTDIYYLTHRCTHSDQEARRVLTKLFVLFEVLDTAGMDARRAVLSCVTDYEDAVMIETAVRCELDCIVTRNIKDYTQSPIPVYTPSVFLKRLDETIN